MATPALNWQIARPYPRRQRGMALIIVLGMMSVIFVIAAISVRLTMLSERSARNDRDRQIAFQAAEAALADAELDIMGPNSAGNKRCSIRSNHLEGYFVTGCGTSTTDKTRGLCEMNPATASPLYTQINFEETTDSSRRYATFGEFTGRSANFKDQAAGGMSARTPRYIIEVVNYVATVQAVPNPVPTGFVAVPEAGLSEQAFLITGVGYGTSDNTKVMLQAMIFKPLSTPGGC